MIIKQFLPRPEFILGQIVAIAGLCQGDQAAANPGHNLGLPADDPTFCPWRWKVGKRHGFAGRSNHLDPGHYLVVFACIGVLVAHIDRVRSVMLSVGRINRVKTCYGTALKKYLRKVVKMR